jgi:hypothetical protein
MLEEEPTSKASVLCANPPASPAELSMIAPVMVRPDEPSMEKVCTGLFKILRPVTEEVPVMLCRAMNLGFTFPLPLLTLLP